MHPAIWIVIAIAAVLAVQGAAGWWWWRSSRREAPRHASVPLAAAPQPEPQPEPHPEPGDGSTVVVLVHGILGFGSIGLGRARVHYFRRVARRLEGRNVDVMVARLPMLGGVPARGLALLAQLDRLPHPRIVLVAHSLGGLDARWALARGALGGRVKTLITIGTPHRGTPIADALARGAAVWLRRALARIGLGSDGVDWLTTERLATFNREVPDVDGVTYASIVCASSDGRRVHPLLRVTHGFLAAHGPSDGLVPATSQAWGQVVAEAEVDHWGQIGWSGRHDAAALVERALDVVRALPPGPTVRALTA
jgi:triacylglycerol lipase